MNAGEQRSREQKTILDFGFWVLDFPFLDFRILIL